MVLKAVILCAGISTRTYPLTLTKPKPMLRVINKPILQHNLEQLKGIVKEVILIVGYKKEMILDYFGTEFNSIKLTYISQTEQLGTGHALTRATSDLDDRFIVMGGDDIFFKKDIKKLLKQKYALLAKEVKDPGQYGVVIEEKGFVKRLVEKPKKPLSRLVNTGCYILDKTIFDMKLKKSKRGEFELTDYITSLIKKNEKVCCVKASSWQPITYPWNLLDANELLMQGLKKKSRCKIEKNVTIKGKVSVGKGTIIKSGVYIEGPVVIGENCILGPRAYIRASTSIGNNCKIGSEVEIKNCIIGDGSSIPHLSYVGDSVVGDNVNFGAGTITANLRHDKGIIRSSLKKELIPTGRNKLGVIVGDYVKLGIRTILYPGRKIWPENNTPPGMHVKKDII